MTAPILVMGFGAFGGVTNNPAAELARRVDGSQAGAHIVVGHEMPVSYRRCLKLTQELVETLQPRAILGIGVATADPSARPELCGWRESNPNLPDVDGEAPEFLTNQGPQFLDAGLGEDFARRLGVRTSRDPGRYVCNGWLYLALLHIGPNVPVGFLHVPSTGFPADRLKQALAETHFQEAGASA